MQKTIGFAFILSACLATQALAAADPLQPGWCWADIPWITENGGNIADACTALCPTLGCKINNSTGKWTKGEPQASTTGGLYDHHGGEYTGGYLKIRNPGAIIEIVDLHCQCNG